VDEHSIARIRNANFSHSVRGYDRSEVDRFLAEVADWIETGGGEDAAASETVRVELERIGERTGSILTEAHVAAEGLREDAAAEVRKQLVDANMTSESLRAEAGEYSADIRDEADTYSRKVRSDADAYAESTRTEVDAETAEDRAKAQKEAERIVADASRRRADVESVISDLEQRRDAVLAELERLASGIAGTATEHRPPEGVAAVAATEATDADRPADQTAEAAPATDTDEQWADDSAETTVLARESD
jgi:DivIVA domain-containing protein